VLPLAWRALNLGKLWCPSYTISSQTHRRTPSSPSVKPSPWLLSLKSHDTPPWSICHMYIAIQKLLLKNLVGKIKEKHYNTMPPKTPLKTEWEKYKKKPYGICPHLYLYCLIKNFIWETLGKTHKGKIVQYQWSKDHQRVITWDFTHPKHCKPQGYPIPIPWT
jgi:hypothetical protein